MKKILFAVSLLALASMAFGQDLKAVKLSAGAYAGFEGIGENLKLDYSGAKYDMNLSANALQFGAFVDATYVVASVGVESQVGKNKLSGKATVSGTSVDLTTTESDTQNLNVTFQVLGKYPFTFAPVTVFPLVGVEYDLNVSFKDKDKATSDAKAEANDLYIDLGAGLDYPINDQFYVRGQALFGINLTPTIKSYKDVGTNYSDFGYKFGGSVGVGYKF